MPVPASSARRPSRRRDPTPDLHDYAQTNAATTNYVRTLARPLALESIWVNGVTPGPIWTPLQVTGGATQDKLAMLGPDVDGPAGSAGGACVNLCVAYRAGRQLFDRPDLRCGGRVWPVLIT